MVDFDRSSDGDLLLVCQLFSVKLILLDLIGSNLLQKSFENSLLGHSAIVVFVPLNFDNKF